MDATGREDLLLDNAVHGSLERLFGESLSRFQLQYFLVIHINAELKLW